MVVVVLLRLLVDIPQQQTAPSALVATSAILVAARRASSFPLRRVRVCGLGVVSLVPTCRSGGEVLVSAFVLAKVGICSG